MTNIKAEALAFSRTASTVSQLACPRCQLDKSAFRRPSSCSRRPTSAGRRCSSPAPLQGRTTDSTVGERPRDRQGGWQRTPAPSTRKVQVKGPETVPTSTSVHTPHTLGFVSLALLPLLPFCYSSDSPGREQVGALTSSVPVSGPSVCGSCVVILGLRTVCGRGPDPLSAVVTPPLGGGHLLYTI